MNNRVAHSPDQKIVVAFVLLVTGLEFVDVVTVPTVVGSCHTVATVLQSSASLPRLAAVSAAVGAVVAGADPPNWTANVGGVAEPVQLPLFVLVVPASGRGPQSALECLVHSAAAATAAAAAAVSAGAPAVVGGAGAAPGLSAAPAAAAPAAAAAAAAVLGSGHTTALAVAAATAFAAVETAESASAVASAIAAAVAAGHAGTAPDAERAAAAVGVVAVAVAVGVVSA